MAFQEFLPFKDPIEDATPITKNQFHYIMVLASWLGYKKERVHIKVAEVLGKSVCNLWELRSSEASKVIYCWKRLKREIQED